MRCPLFSHPIVHANRIVVIEHGRIVETGTHEGLLSHRGHDRQMVELQTLGDGRLGAPA